VTPLGKQCYRRMKKQKRGLEERAKYRSCIKKAAGDPNEKQRCKDILKLHSKVRSSLKRKGVFRLPLLGQSQNAGGMASESNIVATKGA